MSDHIGDDIHLRGIAMRNLKIQHEIDVRGGHVDVSLLPAHLADIPLLQDHHLGLYINNLAKASGCIDDMAPFKHLKALPEDTGEEFLAEYFHSQLKRNEMPETMPNPSTDLCGCCAKESGDLVQPDGVPPECTQLPATALLAPAGHHPPILVLPLPGQLEEEERFCCGKFEKYSLYKIQKGRYPPGRVPHDKGCHVKVQKNKDKAQSLTAMTPGGDEPAVDFGPPARDPGTVEQEGAWL
mmetsp:Transcript_56735/g.111731  ORF Transcript_56735/g.111731 Transcript_56735/m.111731 type:complete len:240 (-) Transcript_56735:207-926(-)